MQQAECAHSVREIEPSSGKFGHFTATRRAVVVALGASLAVAAAPLPAALERSEWQEALQAYRAAEMASDAAFDRYDEAAQRYDATAPAKPGWLNHGVCWPTECADLSGPELRARMAERIVAPIIDWKRDLIERDAAKIEAWQDACRAADVASGLSVADRENDAAYERFDAARERMLAARPASLTELAEKVGVMMETDPAARIEVVARDIEGLAA
ncbi:hypothetical protein SPHINGO361_140018 [Sphingomonas sp. EC-HK361]|nr:hypothetical protein SPHINGO361_140018 [Sphingomonas sp. EC-HK361]